ncbi:MAG: hypothetical protein RBU37_03445 [Myxococcota bacterium]|nr:hypothetical protein [Myxococcota bacterium]
MSVTGASTRIAAIVFVLLAPVTVYSQGFDFTDEGGETGDSGSGDSGSGDSGGFDFGADGGDTVAPQQYTIDESSPTYAAILQADEYAQRSGYFQAALLYHQVLTGTDDTAMGLRSRALYEMGRTLFQLGLFQSALSQFDQIVLQGPTNEYFLPTLQWLVLISRELPGEPARYERIYTNYLNFFPERIDLALQAEVGYLMGMAAYQKGLLDDAIFFFGHVGAESELYAKARFVEGVTFVRKYNGQQAVASFKDVLRHLGEKGELTREEARLEESTIASLGRVFYQVGHGLWVTGERAKAVNSWNTAIKYFATFRQSSPMWLQSLFEASWTYYRVDNFNKALGLLHTLNSPFFNDQYFPEAMLLQAQIYFTNCHYDRVMYILEEYKEQYPKLKEKLENQLTNLLQPDDVYAFLTSITEQAFDPGTKQLLNAALQDRDLRRTMNYIDKLDEEMERIKNSEQGFATHALAQSLIQELEITRGFATNTAGEKAKGRLERVVDELNRLNNMALDIEIETTEAFGEQFGQVELDPNALLEFEREIDAIMSADDEHIFWTFDGEYWRDELGYYYYYINSRCGR